MSRVLEVWETRLRDWAVWTFSGPSSAGVSKAYRDEWWTCPPQPPMPLVGEAMDTDSLVRKLEPEQREIVVAVYLWTFPETMEERAKILRMPVRTLYDKLRQAKLRLDDLDHASKRALTEYHKPMLGFGMA